MSEIEKIAKATADKFLSEISKHSASLDKKMRPIVENYMHANPTKPLLITESCGIEILQSELMDTLSESWHQAFPDLVATWIYANHPELKKREFELLFQETIRLLEEKSIDTDMQNEFFESLIRTLSPSLVTLH